VLLIGSSNAEFALGEGMEVLKTGGSALDAVEHVVRRVEANPEDHSVGVGGWPNLLGEVELDASIMRGADRACGAVAGLIGFPHAISVARKVMELLPHVFLVGRGAADFAEEAGFQRASTLTETAAREWSQRLAANVPGDRLPQLLQRQRLSEWALLAKDPERTGGTVNVIAVDGVGHVASAVSTSGWAWKYPGRAGDSPVIGAGNYCDDRFGAAACTGHGELAIRGGTARSVVLYLKMGVSLPEAVRLAMEDIPFHDSRSHRVIHILALTPEGAHTGITSTDQERHYCFLDENMIEPEKRELARFPA
jgi:L-asparaginase / beta-aspartyl-peptidase